VTAIRIWEFFPSQRILWSSAETAEWSGLRPSVKNLKGKKQIVVSKTKTGRVKPPQNRKGVLK